jgi:hypothetical protein
MMDFKVIQMLICRRAEETIHAQLHSLRDMEAITQADVQDISARLRHMIQARENIGGDRDAKDEQKTKDKN